MADPATDDLIADLVKPGVAVSYHMGDGSTARARYPFPPGADLVEGVENRTYYEKNGGRGACWQLTRLTI